MSQDEKNDPRLIEWYQATPNLDSTESADFLRAAKSYVDLLASFLHHTLLAKQYRLDGRMVEAKRVEAIAEQNYHFLPELAKW